MTPQEFKARLHKQGKTLREWAIEHGYHPRQVYRVINGENKATFGIGHRIAVDMGLKPKKEQ